MRHWIAVLATNLMPTSLKPTPTPTPRHVVPSPIPTTIVRYIPITDTVNGLNTVFLILALLALAGAAAWLIWMFGTGRLVSSKAIEALVANDDTQKNLSPRPQGPKSLPGAPGSSGRRGIGESASANIGPPQPEDPLKNKRWIELAEGCTGLFDELDGRFSPSDPRQEVALHTQHRLQEILNLSGVETISRDRAYDIKRHQLVPPDPSVAPGTPIARIISPGFAIGGRVLRPAKVQVIRPIPANRDEEDDA